jgi:hypothetical protein
MEFKSYFAEGDSVLVGNPSNEEGLAVGGASSGQGVLGDGVALVDLVPDGLAATQDLELILGVLGTVPRDVGDAVAGHVLARQQLALVFCPGDVEVAVDVRAADDGAFGQLAADSRHPARLAWFVGAARQILRQTRN